MENLGDEHMIESVIEKSSQALESELDKVAGKNTGSGARQTRFKSQFFPLLVE